MAKRILTSIRFDEEKIELIKNREGIESVQGCVDFMIERYYSAYGIRDNFFLNVGVPKNEESKPSERVLVRREPIDDSVPEIKATPVMDKESKIAALRDIMNGTKPKVKQRSFEDYKRWKREILEDDFDGREKFEKALAEDEFLTSKQKGLIMG